MKEILGFHLIGCPYCENAFRAIDELVAENPAYADIHINWVEDCLLYTSPSPRDCS